MSKLARLLSYGGFSLAISSFLGQMAGTVPFFGAIAGILFFLLIAALIAVTIAGDAFDAWFGFTLRWSFGVVLGFFVLALVGGLLGWLVLL